MAEKMIVESPSLFGGEEAGGSAATAEDRPVLTDVKVRPTLTEMAVGDEVAFPVIRMKSVRAQCSELGVMLDRRYQTRVDRAARTIIVTRVRDNFLSKAVVIRP